MKLKGRASIWKRAGFASRIGQVSVISTIRWLYEAIADHVISFQLIQQNGIFHVSHTIETIITHLSMNPHQRQPLKDELATFWREHPDEVGSWYALRKLPYLTACINEGLRLGAASLKRSPRVFPDDDIHYNDWVIPKGVSTCLRRNIPSA